MPWNDSCARGALRPYAGLSLALAVCVLWALSAGLPELGLVELLCSLWGRLWGEELDPVWRAVFFDLRLPRVLLAVIAGAGLALAGAGTQAVLGNPLVSPSILGLTAGASLGASLVILYGGAFQARPGQWLLAGAAFCLALLAVLLTYALASFRRASKETIILAGIAVSYIFTAGTVFLQYLAPYQDLRTIVFWSIGSLWNADFRSAGLLAPLVLGVLPPLLLLAPRLNALALGEEGAAGVGVGARPLRLATLGLCALISACIVSFTGAIGFIDLVAPHLARGLVGLDNRRVLPGAMLVGALLLLAAETAARSLMWPGEMPVGVMTSMIGGPFLLFLLLRRGGLGER
ncbi:MAG: iron ABC transporter permease [Deltaproteobacteria bacterium]|jgi:iron complex transport system permease protein|nr:iron ABC transporter permease [Deltaproteobacteria bacterium]